MTARLSLVASAAIVFPVEREHDFELPLDIEATVRGFEVEITSVKLRGRELGADYLRRGEAAIARDLLYWKARE